jgi:hypothetical protein
MARLVSALQYLLPFALGSSMGFAGLFVWQTTYAQSGTPSISLTQPSDGATVTGTVSLWAAASDAGFAGVRFQVNGIDIGPEITGGSCTTDWDTGHMADGSYLLTALARTDSGLLAGSPPVLVMVSNAAPEIVAVKVWNISDSGASITWYTPQAADSQLDFGLTPLYGNQTPLISEPSTAHTQVLTGLTSGTKYHFRVYSQDALGRRTVSADQVFTTTGPPQGSGQGLVKSPVIAGLAGIAAQTSLRMTSALAAAFVAAGPVRISSVTVNATSTTAWVTWVTDQAADSQFRYGPGRFQGSLKQTDATLGTSHAVFLTHLLPGTTYLYQVQSRNKMGRTAASATLKFTTLPG